MGGIRLIANPKGTRMQRFAEWVVRHRWLVMGLTLVVSGVLAFQIRHLKVIIDPNTNLPQQHPYVIASNRVEALFGSKYVVVIGITPKEGDLFNPSLLGKVERITAALLNTPGVIKGNLLSLAARRAKKIVGTEEGMEVRPLMEAVPRTPEEIAALRRAVYAHPVYLDTLVSRDGRTAAILAEFKEGEGGFRAITERVQAIADRERDPSVEIAVSGLPIYLAQIEGYSQRMATLFPIAVLITGLIHYEAFRTIQGLLLPLVTALLAVVWGLGIMGWAGVPMDAFNATTPILILAVAAGHAVQILKRYYEEYRRLRETTSLSPREANRAAVVASMTRIGPVMLTTGGVAALGFLSLAAFKITAIRTFGLFSGLGILSALVLELTLIHILRSLLPPPREHERQKEQEKRIWDRITETFSAWILGKQRRRIYVIGLLFLLICIGGAASVIADNSSKSYFFQDLPFQQDDRKLNERLGGTNTLYLLVEGREEEAVKDPRLLQGMEATQRFLERQPQVGKTLSIADFIKRMNRAMHGDDPAYDRIPESRELISQYLLLYSMSGEPGDFDSFVDYGYRSANISVFLKTDSSAVLEGLVAQLNAFLPTQFGPRFGSDIQIRFGGSVPQTAALSEAMVQGKLLNILQIGGVILLIVSILFRSLPAGLLVLVPLVLAVLANFGLMGLAGIRLNIATSLISPMAVGIGADYAIYLIFRLREELRRGADERTAFRTALGTSGKAILFVASAIAGGYGVLLFSYGFYVHIWFAILIASAMLVSALSTLTLFASLILTLRPRFIFGEARQKPLSQPAVPLTIFLFLVAASFPGLLALGLWWPPHSLGYPSTAFASEMGLTALEIMEKNFIVTKVLDSTSDATFTLINKNGQERVRKTFITTKLQPNGVDNRRMVRFLSPSDVKGTVTLMVEHSEGDDDIWIYLPALKKVRRLVASNKKDSFVGTDFSYGDVIGQRVGEWEHRLIREEEIDGQPCYVIESLPKNEVVKSNSGYARRLSWIQKDNFMTVKGEFWDPAGALLKTATFTDVRLVDQVRGRWQAMRLEAESQQTGHRTVIRFENFRANQGIQDDFFTTRYMEREP